MDKSSWLGKSQAASQVRDWIKRAAGLRSNALVTGETGCGKGLVGRELHAAAPWATGPFVHADLASLAPSLLESELFGHERGAFTGAEARRIGRFEAARGGTLFLDEIGELSLAGQSRLLRVLQDRRFERLGGRESLRLEARIVSATNLRLEDAVREGGFRRDLFHRLEVLRLDLPPLRDRPEDLEELAESFLGRVASTRGLPRHPLPAGFLERLRRHPWEGNVRELEHVLERALFWAGEAPLSTLDLERALSPSRMKLVPPGASAPESLAEVLRSTGGNVSRAARRLGVPRTSLRRRIRREGLEGLVPRD